MRKFVTILGAAASPLLLSPTPAAATPESAPATTAQAIPVKTPPAGAPKTPAATSSSKEAQANAEQPHPTQAGPARAKDEQPEQSEAAESPQNPHQVSQNPHAMTGHPGDKMQLLSQPDPSVPAGALIVKVVDGNGSPVPSVVVKALETLQSISEGNTARRLQATTNESGEARFDGLDVSLKNNYKVSLIFDEASYEAPPFHSDDKFGHRITVPVYPAISDPSTALVGMRGFIYVALREGEFSFDLLYRVFTLGDATWRPANITLELPTGADAIQPVEDLPGFVVDGAKVRLEGSYPPGQKDVRVGFRIPSRNRSAETFHFSLPPNVVELRVLAERAPGMELRVPGFEPVQEAQGPEGGPIFVTRRLSTPGGPSATDVTVELLGLPTIGPERWYAVGGAALLALAGLAAALLGRKRGLSSDEQRDRKRARDLLLSDLILLERSRESGEIGPQTYEQARRELISALARLEDSPKIQLKSAISA